MSNILYSPSDPIPPFVMPEKLELQYYHREMTEGDARYVRPADLPQIDTLVQHMISLTLAYGGEGLSAPQVGVDLRVIVVIADKNTAHAFINPVITSFGGRDLIEEENCLSLPGGTARVTRSESITVESGTLENPDAGVASKHKGRVARVIHRQVDLLNGIFFINRVSSLQRNMVLGKYAKWRKTAGLPRID